MEKLSLLIALLIFCTSCDGTTKLTASIPVTQKEEVEADTEITTIRFDAPQLVDNNTIYHFLNTVILIDTLSLKLCNVIIGQDYFPLFTNKNEAFGLLRHIEQLSIIDVDFMYKQSLYSPQFVLQKDKFKSEKRIIIPDSCEIFDNTKEYWHNISKQFGPHCSISLPLFSEDRNTAVISYSYNCGRLCGDGGIYVFRKENEIWTLITVLEEWVS